MGSRRDDSDDALQSLDLPSLADPVKQWLISQQWVDEAIIEQAQAAILADHRVGPLAAYLKRHDHITATQEKELAEIKAFSDIAKRFSLEKKLGAGGVGAVYLASDKSNADIKVAIKFLHAEISTLTEHRERFEREAQALDGVDHPVIPALIERSKGTDPKDLFLANKNLSAPYIAMEFVTGRTIGDLIRQAGQLDEQYVLWAISKLAHGLEHVRQVSGIIHRDIKPENIIVAMPPDTSLEELYQQHFGIKILDFGLAKTGKQDRSRYASKESIHSEDSAAPELETIEEQDGATMVGQIIGTPKYMAPEQIMGKELGWRADQYALGVTMYHMITGRTPFNGPNSMAVLSAHLRMKPHDPCELRPNLSSRTARIILRMLEKEPEARYGSYLDLIEACERAIHALENPEQHTQIRPNTQAGNTVKIQRTAERRPATNREISSQYRNKNTSGRQRRASTEAQTDPLSMSDTDVTASIHSQEFAQSMDETGATSLANENPFDVVDQQADAVVEADAASSSATQSLAAAMQRSARVKRSGSGAYSTARRKKNGTGPHAKIGSGNYAQLSLEPKASQTGSYASGASPTIDHLQTPKMGIGPIIAIIVGIIALIAMVIYVVSIL